MHSSKQKPRFLFILKYRDDPYATEYSYSGAGLSSGLLNSAKFVVDALNDSKRFEASLVQVVDNNCIDREVALYKPTHVIIEAFWVVPEKFDVLKKLHPKVTWIVRNHSKTPFLAQEGIAMEWILGYLKRGVKVASNNVQMYNDLVEMVPSPNLLYLPNIYPIKPVSEVLPYGSELLTVDIGCFGAIRPLKNQLQQAVAAIIYARKHRINLRFHINATRVEQGNNVLKNLRALFAGLDATHHRFQLVEHDWLPHDQFLELIGSMHLNLCVSFSESFCIVAADSVLMGRPVVASPEVSWLNPASWADPTDVDSIVAKMSSASAPILRKRNLSNLKHYSADSLAQWEHVWGV